MAIESFQSLLPWPKSFPDDKSSTKLCILSHLIGKNGTSLHLQILDSFFKENTFNIQNCLSQLFLTLEETKCDIEERTLKRGGYHCKNTCIDNNMGYQNWSMAWERCVEVECCTRIFRWTNGSHYYYYLRKADDIFDDNPRFLHVNFNHVCRGKASNYKFECHASI